MFGSKSGQHHRVMSDDVVGLQSTRMRSAGYPTTPLSPPILESAQPIRSGQSGAFLLVIFPGSDHNILSICTFGGLSTISGGLRVQTAL